MNFSRVRKLFFVPEFLSYMCVKLNFYYKIMKKYAYFCLTNL